MSPPEHSGLELVDLEPTTGDFRRDLLVGLQAKKKSIPSKYFYDARGSELFEQICAQPEYYLTRAELEILRVRAPSLAAGAGRAAVVVELGSGSSTKTRVLLDRLDAPRAYVPVDISRSALLGATTPLAHCYPQLEVVPICADFTRDDWHVPGDLDAHRRIFFFPGSTLGNFAPDAALAFLRSVRARCRSDDMFVLGIDLVKAKSVLEAAYNDAAGVTAAFNLNLLERANRELDLEFPVANFEHRAVFDAAASRIEMRLVSRTSHTVLIDGHAIDFARGEWITTEYSHKYDLAGFRRLASEAGFRTASVWSDHRGQFSVHVLAPEARHHSSRVHVSVQKRCGGV